SRAKGGFRDGAWDVYLKSVRRQVERPVFALALAGFAVGLVTMVRRRDWLLAPLLLWAAIVTMGFGQQAPALSHVSRYPSYVTPAFVVLAAYAAVRAGEAIASNVSRERVARTLAMAPVALLATW